MLPEERVRQRLYRHLVEELGYPPSLIALEVELKDLPHLFGVPVPKRRLDLLCLEKVSMRPLLLVECKAVKLTQKALDQLLGYNYFVEARYLALVNETGGMVMQMTPSGHRRLEGIPPYAAIQS